MNTSRPFLPSVPCQKAVVVFLLWFVFNTSNAQIVRVGLTGGSFANWVKMDDRGFLDTVAFSPRVGYRFGAVASFKVRNRYFLHTEYVYSMKGKLLKGRQQTDPDVRTDPDLKDKVNYHYFEVPILFSMHFKGKLGKNRNFKWYAGAGPNTAFLLGGRGTIINGELLENGIDQLEYKIKFNKRTNRDQNDEVHYDGVKRVQFGINLGVGIVIEPSPKQKFMLDFRYTFDQTIFGKTKADYLIPYAYDDNLRFRNRVLGFSLIYLWEYNLSKQERNKGKSNVKF